MGLSFPFAIARTRRAAASGSGAWLGDQGLALRFMGLVSHFGFADVMTPAWLGITGDEAKEMMGMGLVMLVPNVKELY